MNELYPMIFKRKSFHLFKNTIPISTAELQAIEARCRMLQPLDGSIRIAVKIVPEGETTCRRGAQYCLLFYSEEKDHYLENIGYLGEQLDLFLASMGIGALWYGIGRPQAPAQDGLSFVIMMAIAKVPAELFRKDMFKSKRRPLEELWAGDYAESIGNIVRFAPSACNTQPWWVEACRDSLRVYRRRPDRRGIMPAALVPYYNRIDIGIFLLVLELCLAHECIGFERTLCRLPEEEAGKIAAALYRLYS